jgi:hypothetical protein
MGDWVSTTEVPKAVAGEGEILSLPGIESRSINSQIFYWGGIFISLLLFKLLGCLIFLYPSCSWVVDGCCRHFACTCCFRRQAPCTSETSTSPTTTWCNNPRIEWTSTSHQSEIGSCIQMVQNRIQWRVLTTVNNFWVQQQKGIADLLKEYHVLPFPCWVSFKETLFYQ